MGKEPSESHAIIHHVIFHNLYTTLLQILKNPPTMKIFKLFLKKTWLPATAKRNMNQ